jgi:hypothetical protein
MTSIVRQHFADAQAAFSFVIAQGRNIETRVYQRRYPTLNYGLHVPVVTEGNEWAAGTTFFTVDSAGEAKFLSGAATDMPFNQVARNTASHDFAMIGSGWEWSLEEINQATLYGVDLNRTKAFSAADKVERLLNAVAMVGTAEKGWSGFVNDPNVWRVDVAADGADASALWSAKTADEILRDVNDLIGGVRERSGEVEWIDSLRLPPEAFRLIATKRLADGDGYITVLDFLRRGNVFTAETGQPLDIQPVRELATAGQGGGGRMVVYRRDPDVLRFHLPMPRRVLQPRQKSIMSFETGIIARTGGTEIRLPAAVAYGDGITSP